MKSLICHPGWRLAPIPVIAAGFLVGLTSCAENSGQLVRTDAGAAAHAVHSEDLRKAMRDLNYRSKEEVAAEIYTGTPTPTNMSHVARSADVMARTAERIPDLLGNTDLTVEERQEFVSLASRLVTQSRELKTQAQAGNAAGVRRAMDRVNATCDSCHTRFRVAGR